MGLFLSVNILRCYMNAQDHLKTVKTVLPSQPVIIQIHIIILATIMSYEKYAEYCSFEMFRYHLHLCNLVISLHSSGLSVYSSSFLSVSKVCLWHLKRWQILPKKGGWGAVVKENQTTKSSLGHLLQTYPKFFSKCVVLFCNVEISLNPK